MKIPFVIDNREHTLADVLNDLMNQFVNKSIDIATGYFTVQGFQVDWKTSEASDSCWERSLRLTSTWDFGRIRTLSPDNCAHIWNRNRSLK